MSEQCLSLNIRAPAQTGELHPTMVWIHGGGFCIGAGSLRWYNGTNMAIENDAIVVTLNYRLGALGFLVTPTDDEEKGLVGNGGMNGIHDQIVALRWVQRHIASFGGDPKRVTLFGESSGGVAVCVLTVSPLAAGLFNFSIISSGPCTGETAGGWAPQTPGYGQNATQTLLELYNMSTLKDLRTLPPEAVQWTNETSNDNFFPGYFVDGLGGVMPEAPVTYYEQGKINSAGGMIIGHTSKDGTAAFYGVAPLSDDTSEASYVKAMQTRWGVHADLVLQQYPLSRFDGSPSSAYIQADADYAVICPSHHLADLLTSHLWDTDDANARRDLPVYVYAFAQYTECDPCIELGVLPTPKPDASVGVSSLLYASSVTSGWACHGSDNQFVFGTEIGPDGNAYNGSVPLNTRQPCPFQPNTHALSKAMTRYWGSLNSGAPVGKVAWPTYMPPSQERGSEPASTTTMEFGLDVQEGSTQTLADGYLRTVKDYKKSDCAFWTTLDGQSLG